MFVRKFANVVVSGTYTGQTSNRSDVFSTNYDVILSAPGPVWSVPSCDYIIGMCQEVTSVMEVGLVPVYLVHGRSVPPGAMV